MLSSPEFAQQPAPDWLVEWRMSILPPGGMYQGRLPLWSPGRPVVARLEYPISRRHAATVTDVPVPDETADWLRRYLATHFPHDLAAVPWLGRDGIPLHMVVYRREPYHGIQTFCNYSDAMGFLGFEPAPLLDRWRARDAAKPAPAVVGLMCLLIAFLLAMQG